jgi:hypothetical protein
VWELEKHDVKIESAKKGKNISQKNLPGNKTQNIMLKFKSNENVLNKVPQKKL